MKICAKFNFWFWLQWGDLLWITFRGDIEAARESDNICHFLLLW